MKILKNQQMQGILNKYFSGKHIALVLSGGLEVRESFDLLNHLKAFSDLKLSIYLHQSVHRYFTPAAFRLYGEIFTLAEQDVDPSFESYDCVGILDWDNRIHEIAAPVQAHITFRENGDDNTISFRGDWRPVLEYLALACADALPWTGRKVLVTAGPTEEPIDPVRLITNRSSGKMGFAIARQASLLGASVTLVSGPSDLSTPYGVRRIDVTTADEMFKACKKEFSKANVFIAAAAVEDLKPVSVSEQKMKKEQSMVIQCEAAVDILNTLSHQKSHQYMVGFSVETENILENSRNKLQRKSLDAIVINNPTEEGSGFQYDTNKATLVFKDETPVEFPLLSKEDLAAQLLTRIHEKL